MRSPRRRAAAVLLALALVGGACGQEADEDPLGGGPTTTEHLNDATTSTTAADGEDGRFTPEPIRWKDCSAGECATLDVPLDYENPTGDTIEIAAARHAATGDRIGALFVNPGGPGASAIEMVTYLPLVLPDEITESFDIVGVDPRGVGDSSPIDCGIDATELYAVDATIETPEDRATLLQTSAAYVADCAEAYGDVLPFVGTRDVARDMDVVRAAMGDDQLSYLGFSYGTAIGQVYAELFPGRVRSMILDGVLELGPTGLELAAEQAAGFETALSRFVRYCDATPRCTPEGGTLAAVEQVLALAEQPGGIPAPDADRPAGPGEANLGISLALYSQTIWSSLGTALSAALDGDGSGLVDLADQYIGLGAFEVYFAVNCLDFAWPTGDADAFLSAAEQAGTQSPHFGEALVNDYVRCVDWPVPPEPLQAVTAPNTPPILVISTTGDPATPYEAGVNVARNLTSGVLVTNEGDGHTVVADGKPCIDDIIVTYLVDEAPPQDGITCE